MCGRYHIDDSQLLLDLVQVLEVSPLPAPRRNIAPGAQGPIVYQTRTLPNGLRVYSIRRAMAGVSKKPCGRC